jgi:hypothetical protein
MSGLGTAGPFTIAVDPRNEQYDPDDERWLDQVRGLYQELSRQVDVTAAPGPPVPGAKGAVDQVVIALGSAGAFEAAVTCLRAWLGRDRDRRISIRWQSAGTERSLTLTGEAVDEETIREVAKAAVGQLGEAPWPAGTEHS